MAANTSQQNIDTQMHSLYIISISYKGVVVVIGGG